MTEKPGLEYLAKGAVIYEQPVLCDIVTQIEAKIAGMPHNEIKDPAIHRRSLYNLMLLMAAEDDRSSEFELRVDGMGIGLPGSATSKELKQTVSDLVGKYPSLAEYLSLYGVPTGVHVIADGIIKEDDEVPTYVSFGRSKDRSTSRWVGLSEASPSMATDVHGIRPSANPGTRARRQIEATET